ncbi:hypothetical protein AWH51_00545 [Clavibacter tessellarius]|uniref:Uncharacterized protein n=2 Tax=Clavibacter tessellarius TaxID=31965 RepID=A0A154UXM6_9MICO|nr:hypothetical protein AWH51_00545 [Clavibacter michiganensis subsp. tessellarius]
MPSDSGGYSGRRADGYIDPFAIPGAGLDADLIRRAAASFTSASTAVTTHGADVVSKWSGISASYRAPEAPSLIETMAPVKTGTESLSAVFLAASHALTAFADEVDRIKPELLQLTGEAEQFITSVVGTTAEGTKIFDYIPEFADRNNDLMRRVAAQVDALAHARDTCVAALSGLDSPMYWLSRGAGQGPAAPAALDTSIGTVLPFGTMKERSCQEAQAHGAQDAFRESVKGGLAMVGFNAHTRKAFDGDLALNSWRGAAASVYLVTTFVLPSPLTDPGEGAPDLLKTLAPRFRAQRGQVVEGFLGSEEAWKTNPGRALGGLEFNVGSVLMPGAEAGAGLKVLASGARGLRFGARATEMGAEGAADAARAGEASSGLGRVLRGTGAVSGRVGDLVAAMSRGAASSVSGSVTGFRDLLARVPKVSVSVEHMVTPDGMRVPTGMRMDVEPRAGSHVSTDAQHHGSIGSSRNISAPGDAHPRSEIMNVSTSDASRPHESAPLADHQGLAHAHHQESMQEQHSVLRDHASIREAQHLDGDEVVDAPMRHDELVRYGGQDVVLFEGPVIPDWIDHALSNPNLDPRLRNIIRGIRFNYENHYKYPHNEVTLETGFRVDSYIPGKEIVSRKHTQIAEVLARTARGGVDELNAKYAPGEIVKTPLRLRANTVFSEANRSLWGLPLRGRPVLELPPQLRPIPQEFLDYADYKRVVIRDTSGHVYNKNILRLRELGK